MSLFLINKRVSRLFLINAIWEQNKGQIRCQLKLQLWQNLFSGEMDWIIYKLALDTLKWKTFPNSSAGTWTLQTPTIDLQPDSSALKGVLPFRCMLQTEIAVWEINRVFIVNRWLLFKRELLGSLLWPYWCHDILSGACHFSIWSRQLLEAGPI